MINVVGENGCSMNNKGTIAKTPFASMKLIGNSTDSSDLEGNETSTYTSIQTEYFTSGQRALSEAYKMDEIGHQSMINMGFERTYGPEPVDNMDGKITRVLSRYSRIYTGYLL